MPEIVLRRERRDSKVISMSETYQMLHITQNDVGDKVDWFGFFCGVGKGTLIEGTAFEAVRMNGRACFRWLRGSSTVRLWEKETRFIPFRYFRWGRAHEREDETKSSGTRIQVPCIAYDLLTSEDLSHEEEYPFANTPRKIATFIPFDSRNGKVLVDVRFVPE